MPPTISRSTFPTYPAAVVTWMDFDGHPEYVFTRDGLLDKVMPYWLPATASSGQESRESFNEALAKGIPAIRQ